MADGQAHGSDCLPIPHGKPVSYGPAHPCLRTHADPSPGTSSADPRLRVGPGPADPSVLDPADAWVDAGASARLLQACKAAAAGEALQWQFADACTADACKVEEGPTQSGYDDAPWRRKQVKQEPVKQEQPPPPQRSQPSPLPPPPPPPADGRPLLPPRPPWRSPPADDAPPPEAKRPCRRTVGILCADADCKEFCEDGECRWCAVHCPNTPGTASICISHYDFPQRCTEASIWCLNKRPGMMPRCRDDKCANHCMDTACTRHYGADKPTRASTNRTRGKRTRRPDLMR